MFCGGCRDLLENDGEQTASRKPRNSTDKSGTKLWKSCVSYFCSILFQFQLHQRVTRENTGSAESMWQNVILVRSYINTTFSPISNKWLHITILLESQWWQHNAVAIHFLSRDKEVGHS